MASSSSSSPSRGCRAAFVCAFVLCLWLLGDAWSLPLSVNSRWIVDQQDGSRLKLACVNWASHLQPMLAEGLSKQPLDAIATTISALGFNCVRLTWPTFLFTNASLAQQTVTHSFTSLNLTPALAGIMANNPQFLSLTLVEAFKAVVSSLGKNGVMVILDNHISKPGWCCSGSDGNGFFGDEYFDPHVWIQGLTAVASMFRDEDNGRSVVGISLRNELRGRRENVEDWFKYMRMGAEAVHAANPDLLLIHSGLGYDTDLHFLYSRQLNETLKSKIVYEVHWYAFSNGNSYTTGNLNHVCESVTQGVVNKTAFLVIPNHTFTGPLFISEFGIDQRGGNPNHNRFINCFFAFAAAGDYDWAYWPLQGSYYIRNGQQDNEEFYGILTAEWDKPRNASFLSRLQALQKPFVKDVSGVSHGDILFHPATGLCLQIDDELGLRMGPCESASKWVLDSEGGIMLAGSNASACIVTDGGSGENTRVGRCGEQSWKRSSETGMQLRREVGEGSGVCLDGRSPPYVLAMECICSSDSNCTSGEDPSSQWFKLVETTG